MGVMNAHSMMLCLFVSSNASSSLQERDEFSNNIEDEARNQTLESRRPQLFTVNPTFADFHFSTSCCRCEMCDGCSSSSGTSPARRLTPHRQKWVAMECCHICKIPPGAAPVAHTGPTAQTVRVTSAARLAPAVRDVSALALRTLSPVAMSTSSDGAESQSTENFQVVAIGSTRARMLFRKLVTGFQCPDPYGKNWSDEARREWYGFQEGVQTGLAMDNKYGLPLLAMKGEIPCAAALYESPRMNFQNTYVLAGLIRNAGDACKGGGAALLCHLIRKSKDKDGKFSALKVAPVKDDSNTKLNRYYESFGCRNIQKGLWTMVAELVEGYSYQLACEDPNPPKCKQYDYLYRTVDAESYFGEFPAYFSLQSPSSSPIKNYCNLVIISFVALLGLYAGRKTTFGLCGHLAAGTVCGQPLLGT